jgi:WD40 repeat protein
MRYKAFISYSHADERWAKRIHRWLEKYRVPRRVIRNARPDLTTIPKRLGPCFRDNDELPASSDLGAVINDTLFASEWLIVVCSPHSASSAWVNEEVTRFVHNGGASRVICLIVDGAPPSCFPAALPSEPRAADARTQSWRRVRIGVAAAMLGVTFDVLWQREQRRLRFRAAVAAVLCLVIAAGALVEVRRRSLQRSEALVVASGQAAESHDYERALRYSVLSVRSGWLDKASSAAEPQLVRVAYLSPQQLRIDYLSDRSTVLNNLSPQPVFSEDGRFIAAPDNRALGIWDAWTGVKLATIKHPTDVTAVAFSPDGRRVFSCSRTTADAPFLGRVSDVGSGREISQLSQVPGQISQAAFSRSGRSVVVRGLTDAGVSFVGLFDVESGRRTVHLSLAETSDVALSGNEARLVVAADTEALVFDARDGTGVTRFAHPEQVVRVAINPDGTRVATVTRQSVRVWNVETGALVSKNDPKYGGVDTIRFASDPTRVLYSTSSSLFVADTDGGREPSPLDFGETEWLSFSPDGQFVAVYLWRSHIFQIRQTGGGVDVIRASQAAPGLGAVFSADGARVLTWDSTGVIRVFGVSLPSERQSFLFTGGEVPLQVEITDRQRGVATLGEPAAILLDIKAGRELSHLRHDGRVTSARFDAEGRRVVTASVDHSARLFDSSTSRELRRFVHDGPVASAIFSSDGRRIVTASGDGTARTWDVESRRELSRLNHVS